MSADKTLVAQIVPDVAVAATVAVVVVVVFVAECCGVAVI